MGWVFENHEGGWQCHRHRTSATCCDAPRPGIRARKANGRSVRSVQVRAGRSEGQLFRNELFLSKDQARPRGCLVEDRDLHGRRSRAPIGLPNKAVPAWGAPNPALRYSEPGSVVDLFETVVGVYSGWGQNDTVRSDGCGYSSSLTNL